MAKRFTVMIVPGDGERVRRIHVRRGVLFSVLTVASLFVALLSYLTYSHFNIQFEKSELQRLRLVNGQQRHDLQRLIVDVELMRDELANLADTEARVRQLADFEGSPKALPVAVGGIPGDGTAGVVDELQQQISQLQLAIDLRRQSQEDVRNLLNDKVSLGRATPTGWPTKGWITSYFGMRQDPIGRTGRRVHEGLDIAANTGTPVFATGDGVVARVEYSKSYGKTVVVDHGYGYRTLYAHNSKNLVKRGTRVRRGDVIAEVGNTGISTGPHIHYEVQLNGVPIDPRKTL